MPGGSLLTARGIEVLATFCLQEGVAPIDLVAGSEEVLQRDKKVLLTELVRDTEATLTLEDSQRFSAYVPLFMRSGARRNDALARVKVTFALEHYEEVVVQRALLSYPECAESPVLIQFPELAKRFDEDGLIDIAMFELLDDALGYRGSVIQFQRGLSYEAVRGVLELGRESGLTIKVAIDLIMRPRIREKYLSRLQEARWWGKPFNPGWLDTVCEGHEAEFGRAPKDDIESLLFRLKPPVEKTQFLWTIRESCSSLAIEELPPILGSEDGDSPCMKTRYFHSIYDRSQKSFRHMDGSVLIYRPDMYGSRLKSKLSAKIKAGKRIKLFRIDGDIPIETWSSLMTSYFNQNEMIIEYLQGS